MGALMISLSCEHPDIMEFIKIKSDLERIRKANISVRVTDKFMEAVKNDADFELKFDRPETNEHIRKVVKAKQVFDELCYQNWDYAEPGILFWDNISNWNLLSNNKEFSYAGVNPCAEEPLPAGGSCLLGSINLSEFAHNGVFDFEGFRKVARSAVGFLNEILEEGLPLHPLQIQRETVRDWKQIGLGIMGLADALIKMGIKYGSPEAIEFSDEVGFNLIDSALYQSAVIASVAGAYPKYNEDVLNSPFFIANSSVETKEMVAKYGLRNSQLLTTAPTGTLSTMLGISGGIEPIFSYTYWRKTQSLHGEDTWYEIFTPIVQQELDKLDHLRQGGAPCTIEDLPPWFVKSDMIAPIDRVKMQAAWQHHIDASISSTVNLPESATMDDVRQIYLSAHENGLKGITIYRENCKLSGVLVNKKEEESVTDDVETDNEFGLKWGEVRKVREDLIGFKTKLTNGCGKFHFQVFCDDNGRPWETFISLGDGGGCERNLEFISKLMSKCLRAGVPVEELIETAKSIRPCPAYMMRTYKKGDTSKGSSCPSSIGYALEKFMANKIQVEDQTKKEEVKEVKEEEESNDKLICPDCGGKMLHVGACDRCERCGYSHCG